MPVNVLISLLKLKSPILEQFIVLEEPPPPEDRLLISRSL